MKITKKKNGRYSCDVEGVNYMILNKKNAYWVAAFKKRDADLRKEERFSIDEHGFDKALELAVAQMKEWTELYNLGEAFTEEDRFKIMNLRGIGMAGFGNKKTKTRKRKRVPEISKTELSKAVDEYLKNGGKITKIDPVYGNGTQPVDEAHEFLLGNNA